MNYSIKANLMINAPAKEVWAVLADFNNVYTWAPTVTHSAALNGKNNEVGAGRSCSITGFGDIEEIITQWQEGENFTFTISDLGPLTLANSRWQIDTTSDNMTKLTVDFNYQLKFGLFGKLLHSLMMRNKLEKGLSAATNALKKRVETGVLIRPLLSSTTAMA